MTRHRPRRRLTRVAAATLLVATAAGCTLPDLSPAEPSLSESLQFRYDARGGAGFIDQAMTITSTADLPVVVDAEIEALDAQGEPLPDVEVESIYGFDEGGLVVVPGQNLDILMFTGRGADRVSDVEVTVSDVAEADFPAVSPVVEAVPVDEQGAELDYPAGFSEVVVRNPNASTVSVRVVLIAWDQPTGGSTQQAAEVVKIGGVVDVPSQGETTVPVSRSDRRMIDELAESHATSLKAFFSR